jgi:hypothetical protein
MERQSLAEQAAKSYARAEQGALNDASRSTAVPSLAADAVSYCILQNFYSKNFFLEKR